MLGELKSEIAAHPVDLAAASEEDEDAAARQFAVDLAGLLQRLLHVRVDGRAAIEVDCDLPGALSVSICTLVVLWFYFGTSKASKAAAWRTPLPDVGAQRPQ